MLLRGFFLTRGWPAVMGVKDLAEAAGLSASAVLEALAAAGLGEEDATAVARVLQQRQGGSGPRPGNRFQTAVNLVAWRTGKGFAPGWKVQSRLDAMAHSILRPTEPDLEMLQFLYNHNYSTRDQLAGVVYGGDYRAAQSRLRRLFQAGLVGRLDRSRRGEDGKSHRQGGIYTLTQDGYAILRGYGDDPTLPEEYVSPAVTGSQRNNPVHDVKTTDFVLMLLEAAEAEGLTHSVFYGPRQAFQRVPPARPGGEWLFIAPDAVTAFGRAYIFVEMEISRRGWGDRAEAKMARWHKYVQRGSWKERYTGTPFALIVTTAQGVNGWLKSAQRYVSNDVVILDLADAEAGNWDVAVPVGDADRVSLWDLIRERTGDTAR